jgi:hypothetical protein
LWPSRSATNPYGNNLANRDGFEHAVRVSTH